MPRNLRSKFDLAQIQPTEARRDIFARFEPDETASSNGAANGKVQATGAIVEMAGIVAKRPFTEVAR